MSRLDFDFIVVGGGSSGSALAARLSEKAGVTVALLESGPEDRSLQLRMPLLFTSLNGGQFDWRLKTEAEAGAGGRQVAMPRGKVLGGSSSINGMMYSRGHPLDYDEWSDLGATGWSHRDVLPFFRRSERNWRGESEQHGGSGPLNVIPYASDEPISHAIHETARRLQHRVLDDFEAGDPEGFALPDSTIRKGRRHSASQAFLKPARRRPNLAVFTEAHAERVIVEEGRAVGVEFRQGDETRRIDARREVIISSGTYGSPQLLMLSGIGPAAHLAEMGISPVSDRAQVGADLQEHPLVPMAFLTASPTRFGRILRADRLAREVLYWWLTGRGYPGTVPLSSIGYYKSRPELTRPDMEAIFMAVNPMAQPWFPGWRKPSADMLTSLNVVLRPRSRGTVRLGTADPLAPPRIALNLLSDEEDRRLMRQSLRWTRDFVSHAPLRELVAAEAMPGAAMSSEEELDDYIKQVLTIAHHPVGTCRMGSDDAAVVDPQLRVRGVDALRVADASVMPRLIGGHTNAPAIMIGERAADFILNPSQ